MFALRSGIVLDIDGYGLKRVCELRCRAISSLFRVVVVHLLRLGVVAGRDGIVDECLCVVFGG